MTLMEEHRGLLKAIDERDVKMAESVADTHIENQKHTILENLGK